MSLRRFVHPDPIENPDIDAERDLNWMAETHSTRADTAIPYVRNAHCKSTTFDRKTARVSEHWMRSSQEAWKQGEV